ncbi:SNF2 family DNA or RNA helicase [Clostridium tetanomorphum]|uniref:DEAD/DEAH box helicase n=1 Tax=Clostridium tetanomorphum TaxID=1553 RepID=A0A923ED76_CLOTT|nr:DEAD/DEAH box helicase [Clostridium tetanomorphum]KAJ50089.1 helicase, Snf2 family protein [Clostridium tetanomorphum DSM 665]MBC2399241.1 DEAD/DEAH box helicase [Clostridium tetanomorphum]MBP1862834.1 SNF2 family DNA or RNA helicase [Clostridium tetanomorphum]NRS86971.1 SNF2 family DNA or RNA helicase [Clostridium tetanomorphum]NRZ99245.1 SNF2 family DNA or RNA helicase [Clostridium tetanomorphum]
MNLKELQEIILKSSSNFMRKKGQEIFKNGLVFNIKGKKIDNIYHVYGDVLNYNNQEKVKTHIKVNLLYKRLDGVSCTCDDFKEISINKKLFMCEHLNATAYKFLSLIYNKKSSKNGEIKKSSKMYKKNIPVSFDVKITCKSWKSKTNYELEFWLGVEYKHLITDLRSFIRNLDDERDIFFNDRFTYNHKVNSISVNDLRIIDFIREYVNKIKTTSVIGRKIIIAPENLREFLQCIDKNKVTFKYHGIEYKTIVFKENLPLSFTLKDKNKCFVLTTHKKLPTPLNINKDVYFFNGNLYLPSKHQIQKYGPLYDKFKSNYEILYNKTVENYNHIVSLLSSISNDITISDGVKTFTSNWIKLEFFIYKEKHNIYCDVKRVYCNKRINILDDENKQQFIRNFKEEEKILIKLEKYKFIKRNHRFMFIGEDEDFFNILSNKENSINSLGTVILGEGLDNIKIYNSNSIQIDLNEKNGYLKFDYNIGDIERNELDNMLRSYRFNSKFYKTKDNGFIDFEDEGVKDFLNLIQILNIDKNTEEGSVKIEKNKAVYILQSLKDKSFRIGNGVDILKDIEWKLTCINNKEVTLPENLKATLRKYQVNGFKWFKSLSELGFGGILADEMGLGKTIQTIAFILSEKNKKSLIITPTSLIYNWQHEIERFAPILKVGIIHGEKIEQKKVISKLEEYNVVLTTYGTLKNNVESYNNVEFDYCIIDEAQNIKNPITQNTKAVKEIKAKVKFALTGTPIENNLIELWSIFDFIMPGYLYSEETFYEKFLCGNEKDLENLKKLIKPFILRRTKKEVIKDLPDKIEKKILVQMTQKQKLIYNAYIKDIREKLKNNSQGKIEVFSYLTKLRQICLDPSLVFTEYEGGSGKLRVAMTLVEEGIDSDSKILIFSQFTSALNKIGKALKEKGIEYFYLDGSTPSKERIKLVNEFNNSDNIKVFLISLKAGGTGLNLTSANLVIHFDPWWNPAVEDQATDRAHRIGQKNVVEVIKLIARGTIEGKIVELQENKKELIDNVITGELQNSNTLNKLSKEELLKLFERD